MFLKATSLVASFAAISLITRILDEKNVSFFYCGQFAFFSGAFLVFLLLYFIVPMFRPKVRLCEHFLILNHHRDVVIWNDIINVRLEEDALVFNVRKTRVKPDMFIVSLSYISRKDELLGDIELICKTKGIPLDKLRLGI